MVEHGLVFAEVGVLDGYRTGLVRWRCKDVGVGDRQVRCLRGEIAGHRPQENVYNLAGVVFGAPGDQQVQVAVAVEVVVGRALTPQPSSVKGREARDLDPRILDHRSRCGHEG